MNSIVTAILAALSQAALAVFARLITKKMFEDLLTRLIIAGVNKLEESTDNKMLDEIARTVRENLKEKDAGKFEA